MLNLYLLNVSFSIFQAGDITCMCESWKIMNINLGIIGLLSCFMDGNCNIITELILVTLLVTASNIITVSKLLVTCPTRVKHDMVVWCSFGRVTATPAFPAFLTLKVSRVFADKWSRISWERTGENTGVLTKLAFIVTVSVSHFNHNPNHRHSLCN